MDREPSKTCRTCHLGQPLEQFNRDASRRDGHASICKGCLRRYRQDNRARFTAKMAQWRAANPGYLAEYARRARSERKQRVIGAYGGACACCGITEPIFLTIDHVGGGGSEHRKLVKPSAMLKWLIDHGFPAGFQILCWNCNAAEHLSPSGCPHRTPQQPIPPR